MASQDPLQVQPVRMTFDHAATIRGRKGGMEQEERAPPPPMIDRSTWAFNWTEYLAMYPGLCLCCMDSTVMITSLFIYVLQCWLTRAL